MAEILDFIVIFLLITAIVYGAILNKRIKMIHESKKELANLFKSFDGTIYKAQTSIEDLKKVSSDISENLQTKIDKAAIVTDDLAFLSEKAAEITNIMEKKVQPYKQTIVNSNTNHTINAISPEKVRELKQKKTTFDKVETKLPTNSTPNPQRTKALEAMLQQIAKENNNNDGKVGLGQAKAFSHAKPMNENDGKERVADMLKALGYGESS